LNDIYNYVAGDPNSLIEQCKTELTNNPQFANLKEDRFPYPTKLLPKAVQDTYVKWGPYGGYQATQSGYQGHLDFPSYLAGFSYGYASNGGQDPNNQYLPGHSFLYVSGLVNIHVITATADFERSIGIY
jgi:hypothetical protein